MNNINSIIVYSSPWEQMFYEGDGYKAVALLIFSFVFALFFTMKISNIPNKNNLFFKYYGSYIYFPLCLLIAVVLFHFGFKVLY